MNIADAIERAAYWKQTYPAATLGNGDARLNCIVLADEVERLRAVILDVFSYEPSHQQYKERDGFGLDTIGNSLDPSDTSRVTIIRVLKAAEAVARKEA
jgi:hypothetical protein